MTLWQPVVTSDCPPRAGECCGVRAVKNVTLESGMVRSPTEGKVDYSLALDGPMFARTARHLTDQASNKGKRNWMNAHTEEDLERFRESAVRHFVQWYYGADDEDHAAALWFNVNGVEYVKERLAVAAGTEDLVDPLVAQPRDQGDIP